MILLSEFPFRLTGTAPFHCGGDEEKLCEIFRTVDMKKRLDEEPEWQDISKEGTGFR